MIGRLVAVQEPVLLSMVRGLAAVPMAPDMFKVMVGAVRVPVPVRVPVAVRDSDDAVILLAAKLMFASVPEALRMREPVVVLSERADAIAMSPAVWVREKVPAKVAGRAVRAPVSLALR